MDGADRDPQSHGDVVGGQVAVVAERDHDPLVRCELSERLVDGVPLLGLGERVARCGDDLVGDVPGDHPGGPSQPISAGVDEDPVEPRLELRDVTQRRPLLPGLDERVVGRVLGVRRVTQDRPGEAVGRVEVLVRQAFEGGGGILAARVDDGRVLIYGGISKFCTPIGVVPRKCGAIDPESALLWSPGASTFATAGTPSQQHSWGTATVLTDGRVLLVGNPQWGFDTPESADVYDPAVGAFQQVDEPRDYISGGQSATRLADGSVLVVGGDTADPNGDEHYFGPLRTAETWDPATGRFSRTGAMAAIRRGHGAALLADGTVIVAGGTGSRTAAFVEVARTSTELWNPSTGDFVQGPAMSDGRTLFTLTTLPDGRVIAIGGDAQMDLRNDTMDVLSGAEILEGPDTR